MLVLTIVYGPSHVIGLLNLTLRCFGIPYFMLDVALDARKCLSEFINVFDRTCEIKEEG